MGALGLLLGPGRGLQPGHLGAPQLERVVAAGVERELALAQMQDGIDGVVQKLAVVADDEGGVRIFLEPCLEPERALQVEIVGGLVEQQQVGLREQGRRQRHPHAPAAGEFPHRALQVGGGEAKPAQDFGRPRRRPIGVDLDQLLIDVAEPLGLGGQGFPPQVGGQDRIQEADRGCRVLLVDRGDASRLGQADVAAVGDKLAQDQLEQRGFANPVAPDQADLGSRRQGHAGGIKKAPIPGVEYEIVDLQHE
jgi:hypothetical protein